MLDPKGGYGVTQLRVRIRDSPILATDIREQRWNNQRCDANLDGGPKNG